MAMTIKLAGDFRMFAEKMDAFLERYSKENSFMGAVRVTVGGKIIYERGIGYADIENKKEINKDTLFTFYSMTKPFTALGIMLLVDAGLVQLDAHPSLYVPELAELDPRVTVRMMLQHISGAPDMEQDKEFAALYAPGTPDRLREHIRLVVKRPMLFAPGAEKFYANINYITMALIIENVSGLSYKEYTENRVLKPLGAPTAYVDCLSPFVPDGAIGYELVDGVLTPAARGLNWMYGAGDIVGTLDDAYVLNLAHKNRLLLSDAAWDEIENASSVSSMGLGNTINVWHGKKRIAHNGGHYGFRTLHNYLPEYDFDVIILSNVGLATSRVDIANFAHDAYFGANDLLTEEYKMDGGYIK